METLIQDVASKHVNNISPKQIESALLPGN